MLLDWNGLSSFEWLFEHVHSHHMHVNTLHDHDAISMRPFLHWLRADGPGLLGARGKHLVYAVGELAVAAQGTLGHRFRWLPLRDGRFPWHLRLAPFAFVLRVLSHLLVQGVWVGGVSLLLSLAFASYYFGYLAHLSHAAPDAKPVDGDFVAQQTCNTADVDVPSAGRHLALHLDRQVGHHLFPAVDHSRLPALEPVFRAWREQLGLAELHRRVNRVLR